MAHPHSAQKRLLCHSKRSYRLLKILVLIPSGRSHWVGCLSSVLRIFRMSLSKEMEEIVVGDFESCYQALGDHASAHRREAHRLPRYDRLHTIRQPQQANSHRLIRPLQKPMPAARLVIKLPKSCLRIRIQALRSVEEVVLLMLQQIDPSLGDTHNFLLRNSTQLLRPIKFIVSEVNEPKATHWTMGAGVTDVWLQVGISIC